MSWTQSEAIELARLVEPIAAAHNCHVALTGGCLYKDGVRKDCDLLFYAVRGQEIDSKELWTKLESIGLLYQRGSGWCQKGTYQGKGVDCFFPDGGAEDDYEEMKEAEATLDAKFDPMKEAEEVFEFTVPA